MCAVYRGGAVSDLILRAFIIGIGATVVMDVWGWVRRRFMGIPTLDYGLVGRWIGHLRHGRLAHARIADASPVAGERLIGWSAHYAIGALFAAMLVTAAGEEWLREPSLWPALAFGVVSVAAPYFILQPALGAGVAAARTPAPNVARLRSLATHAVFGLGLYLSAEAAVRLAPMR